MSRDGPTWRIDLLAEEEVPPEAELIDDGEVLVDRLDADARARPPAN